MSRRSAVFVLVTASQDLVLPPTEDELGLARLRKYGAYNMIRISMPIAKTDVVAVMVRNDRSNNS
jgi:hypothetical protein